MAYRLIQYRRNLMNKDNLEGRKKYRYILCTHWIDYKCHILVHKECNMVIVQIILGDIHN